MKNSRAVVLTLVLGGIFAGGILVGRYTMNHEFMQKMDLSEVNSSYKFINPLLFCQDQNLSNRGVSEMEDEVRTYISDEKSKNELIDVAFYFRDLNGGPWSLVNGDMRSIPASLLKVPLAISVYQRAEQDRAFLKATTTLPKNFDADEGEHFQPRERIQPGTSYTVEDMVRYMLQDSDNAAVYLLANMFKIQEVQDAYTRLGIEAPIAGQQDYTMTVKTYASFFRVLYNGTYLTREDSEHVLSLLSHTSFTQGIVTGVPPGIVVAHKFGEMSSPDGNNQLHDCGIVYKPRQPYLVCIMTKGHNYETLAGVISHISKLVYDHVDSSD